MFYNRIFRLDAYEQEHPLEPLQYFMASYDLRDVRLLLHQLVEVALTTKNQTFHRAKERAKAVRFAKDLEEVIEAIHLLHDREYMRLVASPK